MSTLLDMRIDLNIAQSEYDVKARELKQKQTEYRMLGD